MIFSTVRAPHEPALTVGSLATTSAGRPSTRPCPVTTPSAGKPGASALASWPSSTKVPVVEEQRDPVADVELRLGRRACRRLVGDGASVASRAAAIRDAQCARRRTRGPRSAARMALTRPAGRGRGRSPCAAPRTCPRRSRGSWRRGRSGRPGYSSMKPLPPKTWVATAGRRHRRLGRVQLGDRGRLLDLGGRPAGVLQPGRLVGQQPGGLDGDRQVADRNATPWRSRSARRRSCRVLRVARRQRPGRPGPARPRARRWRSGRRPGSARNCRKPVARARRAGWPRAPGSRRRSGRGCRRCASRACRRPARR